MDRPLPWLRYVETKHLDDNAWRLNGLEVDSVDGDKLGNVEGFIVDVTTGRPFHVVVGAGHWFTHKHFLLPIGHVALDETRMRMIADLSRDHVKRFPGFDKDQFETMSEDELTEMGNTIAAGCGEDEVVAVEDLWNSRHYQAPTWWEVSYYRVQPGDQRDKATGPSRRATAADRRG
jgi:hypothetical protein